MRGRAQGQRQFGAQGGHGGGMEEFVHGASGGVRGGQSLPIPRAPPRPARACSLFLYLVYIGPAKLYPVFISVFLSCEAPAGPAPSPPRGGFPGRKTWKPCTSPSFSIGRASCGERGCQYG